MDVPALIAVIGSRMKDTQASSFIVDAINLVRREIYDFYPWGWNQTKVSSIRTLAPVSIPDVSVTSGSSTVVVNVVDEIAAMFQLEADVTAGIYQFVTFGGGGSRFYRVLSCSHLTELFTFTITPSFIGDTSSTDTMDLYFREYSLPSDFAAARNVMIEGGAPMDSRQISDLWYLNGNPTLTTGAPARYDVRSATVPKMILDPIPDDVYSIPFEYEPYLSDVIATSTEAEMVIPRQYHHIVQDGVLWHLRRDLKDDDRRVEHKAIFDEGLAQMVRQHEMGGSQTLPVIQAASSRRGFEHQRKANWRRWGGF